MAHLNADALVLAYVIFELHVERRVDRHFDQLLGKAPSSF